MDLKISRWVAETFGNNKFFAVLEKLITFLGSGWVLLAIVALLICFKKTRKMGICALFAVGAVYLFNGVIFKAIVKRDRPFVQDENLKVMCELAGYKFPDGYSMASSHAATSMAMAFSVMLHNRKWGAAAIVYSVLIGISRIALCVHFFSDVMVGFAFGIIFAICVYYGLILLKNIYEKRRSVNENNSSGNK